MTRHLKRPLTRTYFRATGSHSSNAPAFLRPPDYRAFLRDVNDALADDDSTLLAYCVMPDRWDAVMGHIDPSRPLQLLQRVIRTRDAISSGTPATSDASVYQGLVRSDALADASDLIDACRDVEREPLRAGLVRRAQDWPWSSLAERLFTPARVRLCPIPFLASRAWIDYVNASSGPLDRCERRFMPRTLARCTSPSRKPSPAQGISPVRGVAVRR